MEEAEVRCDIAIPEGLKITGEALLDAFAMYFNRGGRVLSPTYRYQAVGPFAAWWLDWDAFALPKKEGEREKYRKTAKFQVFLGILRTCGRKRHESLGVLGNG